MAALLLLVTMVRVYCTGGRKQFYIGQAESWTLINVWKNVATHILYTRATCTAQSTISMQGILMLGDLHGYAPQKSFEKQVL